jgi:predicted glycosyltransferase
MASECAILGVPAIYAAQTGRGYTDEQEHRYGLVKNIRRLHYAAIANAIEDIMERDAEEHRNARRRLLNDTIDVARYVVESIKKIAG